MNKNIEEKAKALNQWLLSQDVVKEYQAYEKLIHSHPEINETEKKLKEMQQQIVNDKHAGIDCQRLIDDYEKLMNEFTSNPIVYNYMVLKEEVNRLVDDVSKDIQNQLKKMLTD